MIDALSATGSGSPSHASASGSEATPIRRSRNVATWGFKSIGCPPQRSMEGGTRNFSSDTALPRRGRSSGSREAGNVVASARDGSAGTNLPCQPGRSTPACTPSPASASHFAMDVSAIVGGRCRPFASVLMDKPSPRSVERIHPTRQRQAHTKLPTISPDARQCDCAAYAHDHTQTTRSRWRPRAGPKTPDEPSCPCC